MYFNDLKSRKRESETNYTMKREDDVWDDLFM